ncbi:putative INO80 complex subunit B-like region, Zinc finger, HIT-type, INO80 complex, subunit Ies2 [Senna tora]|uniref:Putative INO80 complex subunit B-like region, Zinc finger, HIT-type, INO80 complex, subunit Ies2 n=1 Tax=Senna tora TaxID=362788 RepID=A0A834X3R4_9FABA|nr:putative INO80 complex subunit B-like region, Zinc finger, HIT-type, INO80 complex, subunit Ies2 [Senna tora]
MEILHGSGLPASSTRTGKRSRASRRPRANPHAMFQSYFGLPSFVEPYGKDDENQNQNQQDIMVASDGSGAQNKLKKLKLKFGGVIHTIHTKAKMEITSTISSYATNSSSSSDDPKYQFSSIESGVTAENLSCREISFGESSTVNHELVRKSKRIPKTKRRALDVEYSNEENEDAELQFLERLTASKIDVGYNEYNQGTLNDSGTPGSSKDGKKKLKSEKKYENNSYMEEGGLTSNGKSISEMKKLKKESGEANEVLFGSNASIIDISDYFIPTLSQRKKGKLSEMEQQLKKAEAAQRRKMQSEKAARESEAEAIRKILGHDSGRKKKDEKMKKQMEEFAQKKSRNSFYLGSNTVRWTIGPSGTVVTFSEDIGLPSIFQMVPKSYPPPRERCAGPNCTNEYKYRDSKSKLPLCSLNCYRAIHEKMQPLIAC